MSSPTTSLTRLGAAFLILAGGAQAQERERSSSSLPIAVGSHVRVQSTEVAGRLKGLVTAIDDGSVTLSPESGPPLKLRLESLTALDTSLGQKRHTLQGLAIGVLGGALLGLAVPVDPNNCGEFSRNSQGLPNSCSRGEAIGTMALGGAGIGAIVGALIKSDRWGPVALTPAAQLRQGGRGFGVVVALSF